MMMYLCTAEELSNEGNSMPCVWEKAFLCAAIWRWAYSSDRVVSLQPKSRHNHTASRSRNDLRAWMSQIVLTPARWSEEHLDSSDFCDNLSSITNKCSESLGRESLARILYARAGSNEPAHVITSPPQGQVKLHTITNRLLV